MSFSQFITSSQFYLYGRWHCTRTGWENAVKAYKSPDLLQDPNLSLMNKVYLITGGNAGIGKEISTFLALKGAIVYLVCRNPERAFAAQNEIISKSNNHNVHVLLGDCGLEADIRRIWDEFLQHQRQNYNLLSDQSTGEGGGRLDGLVCNAGALLNHKTFTTEGVEVTFATHLLFGSYLLGSLAMPLLERSENGKLILVSSGGMYNSKFPSWEMATSTGLQPYDGQFAYVYAKRGQVLLAEEWAKTHPNLTVVSCHPGWVDTPGVEAAYGEKKSILEPLRNTWQGAEGILWLLLAPKEEIVSGEFYLDRAVQPKHLAGPFFTAGSSTKNTVEEVQEMMQHLDSWSSLTHRPSRDEIEDKLLKQRPVEPSPHQIDLMKYMGDWYVIGNIPTPFEVGIRNGIERYAWDEKNKMIKVTFDYYAKRSSSPSQMKMRATVANDPINTHWKLDPKIFGLPIPMGLDYLLLEFSEEEGYAIVAVPDRSYLWFMIRDIPSEFDQVEVPIKEAYGLVEGGLNPLKAEKADEQQQQQPEEQQQKVAKETAIVKKSLAMVERLGYNAEKIIRVPWISKK